MGRRTISMVTEPFAYPGATFQPVLSSKCIDCEYFNACIGALRPLVRYKVVALRNHFNQCPALAEKMRVVEVEEQPFNVVLSARLAVPGATVRYSKPQCSEEVKGKYRVECDPIYVEEGERVKVLRRLAKVDSQLFLCEVEATEQPSPRLWLLAKRFLLKRS